jgi:hypothetical protein
VTDEERAKIKAWVENWKVTGELLDQLKWLELQQMDQQTAARHAAQVLHMAELWLEAQPAPYNRPSGLVEQQYWFSRWPKK